MLCLFLQRLNIWPEWNFQQRLRQHICWSWQRRQVSLLIMAAQNKKQEQHRPLTKLAGILLMIANTTEPQMH